MVVSGKKGVSIPIMLMHEGEGMVLTVETKFDCLYRGLVEYAEDCMNIRMRDVLLTQADGSTSHLKSAWIPGFTVRFVIFPDILEHSPMFRRVDMQSKGKKVSTGLGVLRYAGIRNKTGGAGGSGYGDRDFSIMRNPQAPRPGGMNVYLGGGVRPGPFGGPRPGFGRGMPPQMGMGMGIGMPGRGFPGGFPGGMMGGRPPQPWGARPGMGPQMGAMPPGVTPGMMGGGRPPQLPGGAVAPWGGARPGPSGAATNGAHPPGGPRPSSSSSSSGGGGAPAPRLQLQVQGEWNPEAAGAGAAAGGGGGPHPGAGSAGGQQARSQGGPGQDSARRSRWG